MKRAGRLGFVGVAVLLPGVAAALVLLPGPGARPIARRAARVTIAPLAQRSPRRVRNEPRAAPIRRPSGPPAVGILVLHLTDHSRSVRTAAGRRGPRILETVVRYPATRRIGATQRPGASVGATAGAHPLIVFGHGFSVTPAPYSRLLDAWTRAGYVVAAPVFPLENANAPGGPNERDLVNQPGDVSFVISRLLIDSQKPTGPLSGLVDPGRIAVAGQSDGGDTALAAAYDPSVRDRRVKAAVILSGAEDPFRPDFVFPRGGPPLLATQGTADTINPPSMTSHFFARAGRPKFLLELPGAGHQPPYTERGPDLAAVERATIGFLGFYLKGNRAPFERQLSAATSGAGSRLRGEP